MAIYDKQTFAGVKGGKNKKAGMIVKCAPLKGGPMAAAYSFSLHPVAQGRNAH
jgi:hypothetical protein